MLQLLYTRLFIRYVIEYAIAKLEIKPLQIFNTNWRGICKLTGNNCKYPDLFCIQNYTDNDSTNVLKCKYFEQKLESYTLSQLISSVIFRNFLDFQSLLTEKTNVYEAVSLVLLNAFSKNKSDYKLNTDNPLLSILFKINDIENVSKSANLDSKPDSKSVNDSMFWKIHSEAEQIFSKYIPDDFNEFHFRVMVKNEYKEYLTDILEAWKAFIKFLSNNRESILNVDYDFWMTISQLYVNELQKENKLAVINSISTFKLLISYPIQFWSSIEDREFLEKHLSSELERWKKKSFKGYKRENFLKRLGLGFESLSDEVWIDRAYLSGQIDEFRKSKILNDYSCRLEQYIYTENTFAHLMFYIGFDLEKYILKVSELVKLIDYVSEPIFENKGLTGLFKSRYPKLDKVVKILESELNKSADIESQSLNK